MANSCFGVLLLPLRRAPPSGLASPPSHKHPRPKLLQQRLGSARCVPKPSSFPRHTAWPRRTPSNHAAPRATSSARSQSSTVCHRPPPGCLLLLPVYTWILLLGLAPSHTAGSVMESTGFAFFFFLRDYLSVPRAKACGK